MTTPLNIITQQLDEAKSKQLIREWSVTAKFGNSLCCISTIAECRTIGYTMDVELSIFFNPATHIDTITNLIQHLTDHYKCSMIKSSFTSKWFTVQVPNRAYDHKVD